MVTQTETVVALAGNPNSGKTTVFNNLTGARQHVGNWPGVTVERKEGRCNHKGHDIRVVDLPGVYSLTAYSPDELIARDFIVEESPAAVVDVVDASNLERNLYLAVQILEMEAPLIVALNMMDEAESRGYRIDVAALSREMGVPVVPMVANRNRGTDRLLDQIVEVAEHSLDLHRLKLTYPRDVEAEIARLETAISATPLGSRYSPRWVATKLLEGDEEISSKFEEVRSA
jgi:ferrous iron transport protein B